MAAPSAQTRPKTTRATLCNSVSRLKLYRHDRHHVDCQLSHNVPVQILSIFSGFTASDSLEINGVALSPRWLRLYRPTRQCNVLLHRYLSPGKQQYCRQFSCMHFQHTLYFAAARFLKQTRGHSHAHCNYPEAALAVPQNSYSVEFAMHR